MANTFNDSSYIDFFVGTQGEYDALVQHDKEVQISGEGEKILKDGTEKTRQIARETMRKVKKAMKLDYFEGE